MNIDLDTAEGRKEYLSEKLDDLLDGINQSYGTVLMDELLNRLELTVKDFNEEMKVLCDKLIKKEEERQQLLEMIKSKIDLSQDIESPLIKNDSDVNESQSKIITNVGISEESIDNEIPAWEKKLANLKKK